MSHKKHDVTGSQHAFFRAMVLMGSSLAAGCGGVTTDGKANTTDKSEADASQAGGAFNFENTGGASTEGTGGATVSAGGVFNHGTGGEISNGTGGSLNHGAGGGITGTGGGVSRDGGVIYDAAACPPAQWDCADYGECAGDGWLLPDGCSCNPNRPASAADCAANEAFICGDGQYDSAYQPLTPSVPFQCACVPLQQDCDLACDAYMPDYYGSGAWSCTGSSFGDANEILCGCAIVLLR